METKNPAAPSGARRVQISATARKLDSLNPTYNHPEIQSESLAIRSVMRRCRVSFWHAKTICQLHGLGAQYS